MKVCSTCYCSSLVFFLGGVGLILILKFLGNRLVGKRGGGVCFFLRGLFYRLDCIGFEVELVWFSIVFMSFSKPKNQTINKFKSKDDKQNEALKKPDACDAFNHVQVQSLLLFVFSMRIVHICCLFVPPVDGRNLANQLRLVDYPIIHKVLAPSQLVQDFFHQQYH